MTSSNDKIPDKKGIGRPSSGKSRDQIERNSQATARENRRQAGSVTLRAYVAPATRDYLHQLKADLQANDLGQALDILVEKLKDSEK